VLKLDFPKGMTHIPRDGSGLGRPLGRFRFLLFRHRHAVLRKHYRERRSVARGEQGAQRIHVQPRECA